MTISYQLGGSDACGASMVSRPSFSRPIASSLVGQKVAAAGFLSGAASMACQPFITQPGRYVHDKGPRAAITNLTGTGSTIGSPGFNSYR
jgi:hypothetical protein